MQMDGSTIIQKSQQAAKNAIGKDFYKLLNNANFGYDCRNNLDIVNLSLFMTKLLKLHL